MLAMMQGSKMHAARERELHEKITLTQARIVEETWAQTFLNILLGLHELKVYGKTVSTYLPSFLIEERVSCIRFPGASPCQGSHR